MRVRFWGTRGSIPRPGPETVRYGGNTSCVELRAADGSRVILDSGTGAHELGTHLSGRPGSRGHFLIGHTHWDHIQGFPFFAPFFEVGTEWNVYAPGRRTQHIADILAGQMSYDYHPVSVDSFEASVRFHDLREGSFRCGGVAVACRYMNHPVLTLGYRLAADGVVVVYATDHEPHSLLPLDAEPGAIPIHHEDQRHVAFLSEADLLIHDAQYRLDEFPERTGWGHSPVERVVDYAIAAGVKRVALFHHDPMRDDDAVDRLVALARERASQGSHVPEVFAAAEGQELELVGDRPAAELERELLASGPSALHTEFSAEPATVLVVEDDPGMVALLREALAPEQVRVIEAHDGETALKRAREEHPTLLLLDLNIPRPDGLEVCRRLRADASPSLRHVPILVLTGMAHAEVSIEETFLAGATDYLTKPIKPALVRSRVRGWLLRRSAD